MRAAGGDVVVAGAGLIGLAIAFELAQRGATVRIYDRAEPARAASWAGAGLLAPFTEALHEPAMLDLCVASLGEYARFVERVRDAGGIDAKLRSGGVLHIASDEAMLAQLGERDRVLKSRGVLSELLERSDVLAAEPWLGPHVAGALLVRDEGSVDNRRLGRAVASACEARGVSIIRTASLRVECDARRVLGVATDLGFVAAERVVNACGAWSAQLEGPPPSCRPPVTPVKGQMLALGIPRDFVHRATWASHCYLVPRDDGRLLVGATVEAAGFDERPTAGGMHDLLRAALTAAPALASFSVTETWAGLRPGTPDGLPFLGATPLDGFFLATGHYRNGILLAPITARLIADAIEGSEPQALRPFSIERANAEESRAARTTSV
ncbi:MAG TPA: glycine oxidase ThiO [Candidatus Cybelea sp.]|nr:glycine oxidase ThiO [Candidatus Cybelea sp.]